MANGGRRIPVLMDYEATRQALLRGRELMPVRGEAGRVTHYRSVGTPACLDVGLFDALLADGLIEEVAESARWAMSEKARAGWGEQ